MVDFSYTIDEKGEITYNDPQVERAYINLDRLSSFVGWCQVKTELEYENICQNVQTNGDTNTSTDFLINLLVGCFEFMGDVEFPWVGKTGGKIAGWLLSALVDTWRSTPPDSLQNSFNNVWNGTKQAYDEAKNAVDTWKQSLNPKEGPGIWTKEFTCPKTKEVVTISQLGSIEFVPAPNTTEYDNGAIAVATQSKYLINKILVPLKWTFQQVDEGTWWDCYYTRWNDSYAYDGPFYDGLSVQCMFGVCTSFPDIDIVGAQTNANHYVYFSKEYTEEYDHNWFSNDRLYKGNKYHKWYLVNKDGGTAPDSFVSYLFTDGPGGDPVNGVATHDDIFNNWGCKSIKKISETTKYKSRCCSILC